MKIHTHNLNTFLAALALLLCLQAPLAIAADDNQYEILITISADKQNQPIPVYGNPNNYRNLRRSQYTQRIDDEVMIRQIAERYDLKRVKGWPIRPLSVYCEILSVPREIDFQELMSEMSKDSDIESVQLLNQFSARGDNIQVYNDPYLSLQYNLVDLNVLSSHAFTSGKGVKIAVIDSKIDTKHNELRNNIDSQEDFINNQTNDTAEKHGTAIAGLIVATGNNDLGIVGIAPGASLLGLRACAHEEVSSQTICDTFTLAQALTHAIEQEVQIINLSLTGPNDPLLGRLIKKANEKGIVVVAAAGDTSLEANFPANLPEVIAVQSSGRDDSRSVIFAPGTDLLTTQPGNSFEFVTGSSFAAAQVSGLLALLFEAAPNMQPVEAKNVLIQASKSGYLNACTLLNDIKATDTCPAIAVASNESF